MPKTVEFIGFRPASSAKNETAIVFVHGFTGDVAKTWRRIPEFLQAYPRLNEWAYYHGINLAYLAVAAQRGFRTARPMASKVLEHVARASDPGLKHWRPATEGDALMILWRAGEALAKHQEAAAQDLKPWEASSMEEQALRVADFCRPGREYLDKLAGAYEGKP